MLKNNDYSIIRQATYSSIVAVIFSICFSAPVHAGKNSAENQKRNIKLKKAKATARNHKPRRTGKVKNKAASTVGADKNLIY